MKLNICIVTSEFPPNCAGIGQYAYNLSTKLLKMGNHVTVITRGSWKKVKIENFDGIKVYRVRFLPLPPIHIKIHGCFLNKFFSETFDETSFDIIHYHSPLVPPIKTELPSVTTFHSCWKTEGEMYTKITDIYSLYVRMFKRFFVIDEINSIKNTDKITTVSHKIAEDLSDLYGVGISETTVVENGVDVTLFKPDPKLDREKFTVLYTGRLVYRKGLVDLVKSAEYVCKEYPNTSFVLTGSGALRPTLEKLVHHLKLEDNFSFLGFVTHTELIRHYQTDAIYVLPSYYEGLPTTVLEAMSCGMPVVATNIPGTDEAIANGKTGLLVPPREPKRLAEAILRLLDDEELRKKIGDAGRMHVVNNYDWDIIANKIEQVYMASMGDLKWKICQ